MIGFLAEHGEQTTKQTALGVDHPTSTTRRALEDLTAHRLLQRSGGGNEDTWQVTEQASEWLVVANPETSHRDISLL